MGTEVVGNIGSAAYALRLWVRVAATAYALAATALLGGILGAGLRPSALGWASVLGTFLAGALLVFGSFPWEGRRAWSLRTAGSVLAVAAPLPLAVSVLFVPLMIAVLPALVPSSLAPRH